MWSANMAISGRVEHQSGSGKPREIMGRRRRRVQRLAAARRCTALLALAATTVFTLSACGSSDKKSYDISPIFPLTADKCAKYDGQVEGTGLLAHCWVTKSKCEQAVTDWHLAMQSVPDAMEFRC